MINLNEAYSRFELIFSSLTLKVSYAVTKKDAYVAVQKLFKQLEEQGWQNDRRVTSARISLQDSYDYVTDENVSSSFLNYQYPLTFDQFKQLPSLQFWDLRNGTDVFLDITMQYNFEEEVNNYVYMISLDFSSEEIHINSYLSYDNPDDTMESVFIEAYPDLPQARLYAETQSFRDRLRYSTRPTWLYPTIHTRQTAYWHQ